MRLLLRQIKKRFRSAWLAGWIVILLFSACVPVKTANNCPLGYIPIGVILTNETVIDGQEMQEGYNLALREINPGGVQGCPIKLIVDTSEGEDKNPDAVQKAMLNLKDQNVVAILGGVSNDASKRAAAISQYVQIPVVITADTADDIFDTGSQWVFRINPSNKAYVSAGLDMAKTALGTQVKVAIVYEHSEYGESAAATAGDAAVNRDLPVVAYQGFSTATQDFSAVVAQVKAANPDIIYAISTNAQQAQDFLNLVRSQKLTASFLIGNGSGFNARDFLYDHNGKLNANLEHIILTVPWSGDHSQADSQKYTSGLQAFRQTSKNNSPYPVSIRNVQAYTALHLVVDAIDQTARATPAWLRDLNNSDILTQSRLSLNQTLHNTKGSLQTTRSWPVDFDVNGQNKADAILVQVINGALVSIVPKNSPAINPVFPLQTR